LDRGYPKFKLKAQNSKLKTTTQNLKLNGAFKLKIPGSHNIYNSLTIIALAMELKIDLKIVQKVLAEFTGAWRRFEYKMVNKKKNITIIDDYAHHPTEIRATLLAARQRFQKEKIICVFQPHQYQRTKILFNDFTKAFFNADEVIISEIYYVAGREKKLKEVNAKILALAIKNNGVDAKYILTFPEILKYFKNQPLKNCVIITIGAGDITMLSDRLIKKLC
jgi:UDP-N-acetylmuramate--alanine ligase